MRYRIEQKGPCDYRVRYKPWWCPFWRTVKTYFRGIRIGERFESYEDSANWIIRDAGGSRKVRVSGEIVIYETVAELRTDTVGS